MRYALLRSTTTDPIRDVTLDNNLISGDDDYDEEYYYYDDDYYEYEADECSMFVRSLSSQP